MWCHRHPQEQDYHSGWVPWRGDYSNLVGPAMTLNPVESWCRQQGAAAESALQHWEDRLCVAASVAMFASMDPARMRLTRQ